MLSRPMQSILGALEWAHRAIAHSPQGKLISPHASIAHLFPLDLNIEHVCMYMCRHLITILIIVNIPMTVTTSKENFKPSRRIEAKKSRWNSALCSQWQTLHPQHGSRPKREDDDDDGDEFGVHPPTTPSSSKVDSRRSRNPNWRADDDKKDRIKPSTAF